MNRQGIIPDLALSICEPWAWAIAAGWKPIENRSWPISPRMMQQLPLRIAVQASLSDHYQTAEVDYFLQDLHPEIEAALFDPKADLFHPGCIVGTVDIVGCVEFDGDLASLDQSIRRQLPDYDAWRAPHINRPQPLDPLAWASHCGLIRSYCFLLANPLRFRQPIPAKGKLNFWKLDGVQQKAIERQVKQSPRPSSKPPKLHAARPA